MTGRTSYLAEHHVWHNIMPAKTSCLAGNNDFMDIVSGMTSCLAEHHVCHDITYVWQSIVNHVCEVIMSSKISCLAGHGVRQNITTGRTRRLAEHHVCIMSARASWRQDIIFSSIVCLPWLYLFICYSLWPGLYISRRTILIYLAGLLHGYISWDCLLVGWFYLDILWDCKLL